MTFRLATNDTAITATAAKTIFRCFGRRVVPPDPLNPLVFYRGGEGNTRAGCPGGIIRPDCASSTPLCRGTAARGSGLAGLEIKMHDGAPRHRHAVRGLVDVSIFHGQVSVVKAELIDRIYESAIRAGSWPGVLDELAELTGSRGGPAVFGPRTGF